ncbi:hypothetical protein BDZ90DRAFT_280011 [Jaminaea rosea]|uniref:Uncharacterized protein n=1 Tax=Jaminaea rosea TaxID=1569628 RepID=A0A316UT61_9BASI|nr:hypothetical protein BDZ90DRAFT_280011 [Jaminaea rosea]PWN27083.1 hypothetical protein BDZ90DRAFT_280011 [Jaminaea rosea]
MAPLPHLLNARAPEDASAAPSSLSPASVALITIGSLFLAAALIGSVLLYRWHQLRRRSERHLLPRHKSNSSAVRFSTSPAVNPTCYNEEDIGNLASSASFAVAPLPISQTLGPLASAYSNASLNGVAPRQYHQDEWRSSIIPPRQASIQYDPHSSFTTNCLRGLTQALDLPPSGSDLHHIKNTLSTSEPPSLPTPSPYLPILPAMQRSTSAFLSSTSESTTATREALSSRPSDSSLGGRSSAGETAATSVMAPEDAAQHQGKQAATTTSAATVLQPTSAHQVASAALILDGEPVDTTAPFMSDFHHTLLPCSPPGGNKQQGDAVDGDLSTLELVALSQQAPPKASATVSTAAALSSVARARRQRRKQPPTYQKSRDITASVSASQSISASIASRGATSSPWLGDSTSFVQEQWRVSTQDDSHDSQDAAADGHVHRTTSGRLPSFEACGPLLMETKPHKDEGAEPSMVEGRRPSGLGIVTSDEDDYGQDDGDNDTEASPTTAPSLQRRGQRRQHKRTNTSPIMQHGKWASSLSGTPQDAIARTKAAASPASSYPLPSPPPPIPTIVALSPAALRGDKDRSYSRPSSFAVQRDLQSPLDLLNQLGSPWDEQLARFPGPPVAVKEKGRLPASSSLPIEERGHGDVLSWRKTVTPYLDELDGDAGVQWSNPAPLSPRSTSPSLSPSISRSPSPPAAPTVPLSPSFRLRPLSLCAVTSLALPSGSVVGPGAPSAATAANIPYTVTRRISADVAAKRSSFMYHGSSSSRPPVGASGVVVR